MMELRILSALRNPFICNVHYAFQDGAHLYMVLDLALGGDLRYNLSKSLGGKFTENVGRFYVAQLILALEYCHSLGVLHRDVKPENILLLGTGYIKLTDFGVARQLEENNHCYSSSGTHGYMVSVIG
jgi:serine/threonine protein kinase